MDFSADWMAARLVLVICDPSMGRVRLRSARESTAELLGLGLHILGAATAQQYVQTIQNVVNRLLRYSGDETGVAPSPIQTLYLIRQP